MCRTIVIVGSVEDTKLSTNKQHTLSNVPYHRHRALIKGHHSLCFNTTDPYQS
jgi:hypothetical protein